eukprot:3210355-Alexandrium_andersonii.AAC.1
MHIDRCASGAERTRSARGTRATSRSTPRRAPLPSPRARWRRTGATTTRGTPMTSWRSSS